MEWNKQAPCNFVVKFDGPALADNSIDVNQLAPSLLSFSEALIALNAVLNHDDSKISLQIKALNRGSFIVDCQLTQDILSQIGNFLTSNGVVSVCNAYALVHCALEIITLKKWLKGQKPTKVEESKDKSEVTIYVDDRKTVVNKTTYIGYQNSTINYHITQVFNPLKTEGFESVTVNVAEQEVVVDKQEVGSIFSTPEDRVLTENVTRCVVMIETAAFKENAKWKVKIGEQNSVFVSILDEDFLTAIDNGTERFGKGDILLVELQTRQILSDGKMQISYSIIKVLEHKRSLEQLNLFPS